MYQNQAILEKRVSPMQPDLASRKHYVQKLLEWNPSCKKNSALFYQFETGADVEELVMMIPDGCIDFIFDCSDNPQGLIQGAGLKSRSITLKPNTTYFGFKPFSISGVKNLAFSWNELLGSQTDFRLVFKDDQILEDLSVAEDFESRIPVWIDFSNKYLINHDYHPSLVEYAEILICKNKGAMKIDNLADSLGYTNRYCRSKFKESHGMSIKSYNDILRFQNSVRLMHRGDQDVIDIAYQNHYYDQSHLIKDFKKYTDYTPKHFKKRFYS